MGETGKRRRAGPSPTLLLVIAERRREIGPLFEYCREHAVNHWRLIRLVCMRRGVEPLSNAQIVNIRKGTGLFADWLIPACCAFLEKPVEQVMGPEWVAEFGEKYGVSQDSAA